MALFLESARVEEARRAESMWFVDGIVTNPKRIADVGKSPIDVLEELVDIFDGHVFYQLTAQTLEARLDEAWQAYDLRPDRVVIKLHASTENLIFLSKVPEIEIAITSVFNPLQAYAAAEANAAYVMVHVDRAERYLGDYQQLIRQITSLLQERSMELLATNITTVEQALGALQAGAKHIALPMELLLSVGNDAHTQRTLEELQL